MRVTDGKIGFISVEDGWHDFEVDENIAFTTDENNEATNTLQIPCRVIGEEDEDQGGQVSIFCPLDKKSGKQRLAKLIYFTGVSKKIAKKHKWVNLDDEDADEDWKDELFEPDSELVEEIILTLPGHVFRGEVKTSKGKDRDFQNIIELDFYGKKSKESKGEKKDKTKGKTRPVKEENENEEEAW